MWDYLICSLKNSKIFESYLLYTYQLFYTWISSLDLTIAIFTWHSFVSLRFAYFLDFLDQKNFVYNIFINSCISLNYYRLNFILFMKISLKIFKI